MENLEHKLKQSIPYNQDSKLKIDSNRSRYIRVQTSTGDDRIYDRDNCIYMDPRTNDVYYFLE
jgi:hypothetical protein